MDVQTFHGGQDWAHLENFKEDFSVTTNTVVGPMKARAAAAASVHTTEHYPSADFEPAFSKLQVHVAACYRCLLYLSAALLLTPSVCRTSSGRRRGRSTRGSS